VDEGVDFYREVRGVIRDGFTTFYGEMSKSWRHPEGWQALCREADRVVKTTVTAASPLTDLQKTQLEEKLSRRLGGRVEAEYRVDPSLLGGIRVETDDSVLDGSLIGRLSVWKDVMKQ